MFAVMFRSAVLLCLLGILIVVSGKRNIVQICAGQDVSNEPLLNQDELDRNWNTVRLLSGGTSFPPNAKFYGQHNGKVFWALDWNVNNTGRCSYRKFEDEQIQNAEIGPFGACVIDQQVLPFVKEGNEFLYLRLTPKLLVFYRCSPNSNNKVCSDDPFIRVLSRRFSLNAKEENILRKKLAEFGINLDSLLVVDAASNQCEIPPEDDKKKKSYGRPKHRPYGRPKPRRRPRYRPERRRRY